MKFKRLYDECRKQFRDTMTAMWCSDAENPIQEEYAKQIESMLDEVFSPEGTMPIVQDISSYKSVADFGVTIQQAVDVLGGNVLTPSEKLELWKRTCKRKIRNQQTGEYERDNTQNRHFLRVDLNNIAEQNDNRDDITPQTRKLYAPYKHQFDAWQALASYTIDIDPITNQQVQKKNSVVVTTGTGSGKTECFMVPLVADLIRQKRQNPNAAPSIKAIFLYPLNALMEDQKERLNELLMGTGLTFAVYNGNTPERDGAQCDAATRRRIQIERSDYENLIPTREEIHQNIPDILLTNPTMLEYMLLRNTDQLLFTDGSLDWIAIDETHTYSGAGGTELSMLIRRVLLAFGKTPDEVRFATSSATIGNGGQQALNELKSFILGISGQSNPDQIIVINGEHNNQIIPNASSDMQICNTLLHQREYIPLNELIKSGISVSYKLDILDNYCDQGLKAKVHFFFRSLTNGLKVKLTEQNNGAFKIYLESGKDNDPIPYLDLYRCSACGNYLAIAEVSAPLPKNGQPQKYTYKAKEISDEDIFDFADLEKKHIMMFSLSEDLPTPPQNKRADYNYAFSVKDNHIEESNCTIDGKYHLIGNRLQCPCCGKKLKIDDNQANTEADVDDTFRSFRLSSGFVNKTITPALLAETKTKKSTVPNVVYPYDGHQFISFVDSRTGAANATLNQNLDQEKTWLYSRIMNELIQRRGKNTIIANLDVQIQSLVQKVPLDINKITELNNQKIQWQNKEKYLTWQEICEFLLMDPMSDILCRQFVNLSANSNDLANGDIKPEAKRKYVLSAMYDLLRKRPRSSASPENLGLFATYYPAIESITTVPQCVIDYNANKQITDSDYVPLEVWKKYLHIVMDRLVRANDCVYYKNTNNQQELIDTFACQRYGTEYFVRRSIDKTIPGDSSDDRSVVRRLLKEALHLSSKEITIFLNEAIVQLKLCGLIDFQQVVDETGQNWIDYQLNDPQNNNQKTTLTGLNVDKMAFYIPEKIGMCDTRLYSPKEQKRPVDAELVFMGYSPYVIRDNGNWVLPKVQIVNNPQFPYINGIDGNGNIVKKEDVILWAERENPIWLDLWAKGRGFSNLLTKYYSFPDIYVQAEHTAQVDKSVSKQNQHLFKEHGINILACSTTMEMGVDLGDLEIVVMNSVPPQPSNYKQRAGRCGRNDFERSACITLCGADSIGMNTLKKPMESMIQHPIKVPSILLDENDKVLLRHANALLLREFLASPNSATQQQNNLSMQVWDFFMDKSLYSTRNNSYTVGQKTTSVCEFMYNTSNVIVPVNDSFYFDGISECKNFINYLNTLKGQKHGALSIILLGSKWNRVQNHDAVIDETINRILKCEEELKNRIASFVSYFEPLIKNRAQALQIQPALTGNVLNDSQAYAVVYNALMQYSGNVAKNIRQESGKARRQVKSIAGLLQTPLIEFLATNRFTPNANMPVNVVEFDVNNVYGDRNTSVTNPSYPLERALTQYAPGSSISISNRVRVVRGVSYTSIYRQGQQFDIVKSDGVHAKRNPGQNLNYPWKIWTISGNDELCVLRPFAFLPDVNEDFSRTREYTAYSRVEAELIDATDWGVNSTSNALSNLIDCRTNADTPGSSILYYNTGQGFGYCVCQSCGRTVAETEVYDDQTNRYYPVGMNNAAGRHQNIQFRDRNATCGGNNKYSRNVVLGDFIQTDFAEIRIRMDENQQWIERKNDSEELLITLGIVFVNRLIDYYSYNPNDVSFFIMPNGHICIYDTNPGGSGYSDKLKDKQILSDVLYNSLEMLKNISSKEEILDKSTIRYADKIDIEGAIEWLEKERSLRLPDLIADVYPNVTKVTFQDIVMAVNSDHGMSAKIYVQGEWDQWDENQWKSRMQSMSNNPSRSVDLPLFVVFDDRNDTTSIPTPSQVRLRPLTGWMTINTCRVALKAKDIYPIAFVNGHLYFTANKENATLNMKWGEGVVYCVSESPTISSLKSNIDVNSNITNVESFFIRKSDFPMSIESDTLFSIVQGRSANLINKFIGFCNTSSDVVEISYEDEHLKSTPSMMLTMQFIKKIAEKTGRPYTLTFIVEKYFPKKGAVRYTPGTSSPEIESLKEFSAAEIIWTDRNDLLHDLMSCWDDERLKDYSIQNLERSSLPHYRYLKLTCGKKSLVIYPHGGIHNDWQLDFNEIIRNGIECDSKIDAFEPLPINLQHDIFYVVEYYE